MQNTCTWAHWHKQKPWDPRCSCSYLHVYRVSLLDSELSLRQQRMTLIKGLTSPPSSVESSSSCTKSSEETSPDMQNMLSDRRLAVPSHATTTITIKYSMVCMAFGSKSTRITCRMCHTQINICPIWRLVPLTNGIQYVIFFFTRIALVLLGFSHILLSCYLFTVPYFGTWGICITALLITTGTTDASGNAFPSAPERVQS